MKRFKFLTSLILLMLCMQFADAQVNIYTFSSSVETFTQLQAEQFSEQVQIIMRVSILYQSVFSSII
jgi:hypothetical protein